MATPAQIDARRATPATCKTCQHYASPGQWSARCRLGSPSWQLQRDHPAYAIVRADNSCERHSEIAAAELRDIAA